MRWNTNIEIIWEPGDWITFHDTTDRWLFRADSIDTHGGNFGSSECYCAKKDIFGNGQWQWGKWEKYPIPLGSLVFFHKSIHDFTPAGFKDIRECKKLEKIMLGAHEVHFGVLAMTPNGSEEIIKVGCVNVTEKEFKKIGKKAGWI